MAEESGPGIVQIIRMMLDPSSAKATEKAMQDALKDGTDPKNAEQNVSRLDSALGFLKGKAIALGAALAAAFAVKKVIDFTRESIRAAAEARTVWRQLDVTLNNAGVNAAEVRGEVEKLADEFLRAGIMGDEEMAQVLDRLVQISGDYGRSLNNIGVVADLAAAKHIGLEEAATLVGRAMNGNVTQLQRMGIEIKAGDDAIAALNERFHGSAEAIDSSIRMQKALTEEWGNFQEAIGDALAATGEGESVITTLIAVIRAMINVVKENQDGISAMAKVIMWFVKLPGALILGLFSGLTTVVSAAAKTYWMFAEAASFVGRLFGANTEAIDGHIKKVEDWIIKADEAAKAADRLARALMGQAQQTFVPGTPKPPSGTIGGAVTGAKGDAGPKADQAKTPEELRAAEEQNRDQQIQAAKEALDFDNLRAEGLQRLIALQEEINGKLQDENLTFEERVALSEDLREVNEAVIDGLKRIAADAGISAKALDLMMAGSGRKALQEIAKEAKGRAAWNIAKAIEMFARGAGWISLGNLPSAAAANAAGKMHLASAAKWATLAGGAGMAGGGGETGASGGGGDVPENAGGDAANSVKQPGVQVTVYVDGIDPGNPRHQELNAAINQQTKERYGEDSQITIVSGIPR